VLLCGGNRIGSLAPLAGRPIDVCDASDNPIGSIAELIAHPPGRLTVDLERLPVAEVDAAIAAWERTPTTRPLAQSLRIERALTRGDGATARALASPFAGHRYLWVGRQRTWKEADRIAAAVGGHLVTIRSAEEDAFVNGLANFTFSSFWIGMRAKPTPAWVTGEPLVYEAINRQFTVQAGDVFHVYVRRWEPVRGDSGEISQVVIEWDDER
jgi:hypothetical protein